MKKIVSTFILFSILLAPVAVVASDISSQSTPPTIPTDLTTIGEKIVGAIWIVFVIIAIIAFVIAGIMFVTSQGSPEKVAAARQSFLWGLAGIVVAIIAYVIVSVVVNLFS